MRSTAGTRRSRALRMRRRFSASSAARVSAGSATRIATPPADRHSARRVPTSIDNPLMEASPVLAMHTKSVSLRRYRKATQRVRAASLASAGLQSASNATISGSAWPSS